MKIIDFFAGAGGSSLGASWAGCTPVAAVNHWHIAAATLRANHPGLDVREEDVLGPRDLPAADGLLFSPECTWHSVAQGGRRHRADLLPVADRSRSTAWAVVRWVESLRPEWFVVENVPEFRRWPQWSAWWEALGGLGYYLDEGVLDASRFGVPQARRRWFAAGHRSRLVALPVGRTAERTVRECLDLSLPGRPIAGRRPPLAASTVARIEAGRAAGLSDFLIVYYGSGPQFQSLDRPCRTVTTVDRFGLVRGDTLRMLTPTELRRVQGFPDSYYLAGTRREQVMQLGNAVAPPVMQAIVEEVAA